MDNVGDWVIVAGVGELEDVAFKAPVVPPHLLGQPPCLHTEQSGEVFIQNDLLAADHVGPDGPHAARLPLSRRDGASSMPGAEAVRLTAGRLDLQLARGRARPRNRAGIGAPSYICLISHMNLTAAALALLAAAPISGRSDASGV